jgi:hypothetical protein
VLHPEVSGSGTRMCRQMPALMINPAALGDPIQAVTPLRLACGWPVALSAASITETNRMHLVLLEMQNRTFGSYLAAIQ